MQERDYRVGHFVKDPERGVPIFVSGPSKEKPKARPLDGVEDFLKRVEDQLFIDPRTAAEAYLQELWENVSGTPFPREEVMAAIQGLPVKVKKLGPAD